MNHFFFSLLVCTISFGSFGQVDTVAVADTATVTDTTGAAVAVQSAVPTYYIPYKLETSWVLLDIITREISPYYSFDTFCPRDNEDIVNYIFRNDDKYGVMSDMGDTLLPFEYDSIVTFDFDFIVLKNGNWSYIDEETTVDMGADSFLLDLPYIYTFRNNKMGLMFWNKIIAPPVYEAIRPMNCPQFVKFDVSAYLAYDGKHYSVFNKEGLSMIDEPIDEVECFDFAVIKYFAGNWKYYSINDSLVIDPKGNDILFYSGSEYKIYNQLRTKSALYLNSENKQFGSTYDDYFLISPDYLAVRKDEKIGLISVNSNTQVIQPKYDQIESIPDNDSIFKYFVNDSCGLLNSNGTIHFNALYSNIIPTQFPDRFIVIDNHKTGIVDLNGKVIVRVIYDYISTTEDIFILQKGKRYGMASYEGKILIPVSYPYYTTHSELNVDSTLITNYIFEKNSQSNYLANHKGFVRKDSFRHYTFGSGIVKLYTGSNILVVILDDEGGVLESEFYPRIKMITVRNKNIYKHGFNYNSWPTSYLEENQLSSKYGLRYYAKYGMGVDPIYPYIQTGTFSNFYGERETESTESIQVDNVTFEPNHMYDNMYLSSGLLQNKAILMSEGAIPSYGANSSYVAVIIKNNGESSFESINGLNPLKTTELTDSPIRYTNKSSNMLKRIYMGGEVTICPIEEADISFYEYYEYLNSLGAFSMPKDAISTIMNPLVGVKFLESKVRVCEFGNYPDEKRRQDFSPPRTYLEFEMLGGSNFFVTREVQDSYYLEINGLFRPEKEPFYSKKSVLDVKPISSAAGYFIEVYERGKLDEKIHVDFPNYAFSPTTKKLSYNAGRIIEVRNSRYMLSTPKKAILKDATFIKYLEEEMFGVLDTNGWYIIDRDGIRANDQHYTTMTTFSDGQIGVTLGKDYLIIDRSGKTIVEATIPIVRFDEVKFIVGKTPGLHLILYDSRTLIHDTLHEKERSLGKDFIIKPLGKGKYKVRIFGSKKSIVVRGTPKRIQNYVYAYHKNKTSTVNRALKVSKFRKTSSSKAISDSIAILKAPKKTYYFNQDGKQIYKSRASAKHYSFASSAVIVEKDTTLVLSCSGELFEYEKLLKDKESSKDEPSYSIYYEDEKYGVQLKGKTVVSPIYRSIRDLGHNEFVAKRYFYKTLYSYNMSPITPMDYDKMWFLNGNGFMLLVNGDYFYFDDMNEEIIGVE